MRSWSECADRRNRSFLWGSGGFFTTILRLYLFCVQCCSRFLRLFPARGCGSIDFVMSEDRFREGRQSGEVAERCVRRATCTLDWRGLPTSPEPRRGSSRSGQKEAAPERPVPFLEQAGEPSIYERAFVQVLPCFPEAYRAVIKYMRQLAGVVYPDSGEGGLGGGSDKEPVPV